MSRFFVVVAVFLLSAACVLRASGAGVNDEPYGALNCDSVGCGYDLRPICLVGGELVRGMCEYKKAICKDGKTYDPSEACMANN